MATKNYFQVMVWLEVAISLYFSSGEALQDLPFFHRAFEFKRSICKPHVLDRALHCGCFGYRRFYRKYPEWAQLEQFCTEESDEELTKSAVLGDCRRSQFVRSGRIGLSLMNKYFKRVNNVCMKPSKIRPPRPDEALEPTEIDTKPPPTKVPPTTPVPQTTAPSRETIYPSPATLPTETVRIRYKYVHRVLARFCLALVSRRYDYSPRKEYEKCCPPRS